MCSGRVSHFYSCEGRLLRITLNIRCRREKQSMSRRVYSGRTFATDGISTAVCVLQIKLKFPPIYILHNQFRVHVPMPHFFIVG